jgi:selenide,water dikinase
MQPDPAETSEDVFVTHDFSDDAAVVRFGDDERGLVLTADVIAPLVDDPEAFGEIAATNSISDVYAMGGRPRFALNLVFFPDDQLPLSVLHGILRGGARACQRMGVAIVGGHTVRDGDVKYGLSVTGEVRRDELLSNRTAIAGQALVLTKALGTGIVGTAIKKGAAAPAEIDAAIASMTTPNGPALDVARRFAVTACTDVTGFGLLGHLRNIVRGSGVGATVELDALPLLPGARALAEAGHVPGGSRANLSFLGPSLRQLDAVDPLLALLAADAQTSGGLLLCADARDAGALTAALREIGLPAARIGALHDREPGAIELRQTAG